MENPNVGKNHGSPQAAENDTIGEEYRIEETQRQRPLVLFLRHTRRLQRGGNYLSLSLSLTLCTTNSIQQPLSSTTTKVCALSHIYTYMTFRHIYICVLPIGRNRSGSVLRSAGSLYLPSGGTCFPTNSPFTPAWNVIPIRSAFGMLAACRESAPSSACLTRSRSCGSSSARTLILLLAPGSSDTSAGYASSWSGRPHSSQGGWHFDCRRYLVRYTPLRTVSSRQQRRMESSSSQPSLLCLRAQLSR